MKMHDDPKTIETAGRALQQAMEISQLHAAIAAKDARIAELEARERGLRDRLQSLEELSLIRATVITEKDSLIEEARRILKEAIPTWIKDCCDECGGEEAKCPADCYVRQGQALLAAQPAAVEQQGDSNGSV